MFLSDICIGKDCMPFVILHFYDFIQIYYPHCNTFIYILVRPVMLRRGGPMLQAMPMMAMSNMAPEMSEMGRPSPNNLKPVTKVRKLFPETWLWQNISSG